MREPGRLGRARQGGWTLSASSPPDPGGIASTQCSPRTPMLAELSVLAGAPPNSAEYCCY